MNKRKANYSEEEMLSILNSNFAISDADKENYADRYSHAWRFYMGMEPRDELNTGVDPEPIIRDVVDLNFQILQGLFNGSTNSSVIVTSSNIKSTLANAISNELNTVARNLNSMPRKMENYIRESLLTGQSHMKIFLEDKIIDERSYPFDEVEASELIAVEEALKARGFNDIEVKIKSTKTKRTTKEEREAASKLGKPIEKSIKLYTGEMIAIAHTVFPAVDYIPFEEVYIHPYTQYSLDNTPYMCHRYQMSINDGLMNGWDEDVMKAGIDYETDTDASFATTGLIIGQQYEPYQTTGAGVVINDNDQYFPVYEHYWKGVYKGKTPKYWKFVCTKMEFLQEPEEVDEVPFVSARVHELPNSFYGLGIYDKAKHLQEDATRYKRMLTYSASNATLGRVWALKDAYDPEALQTPRPGGVIEVDAPNAIGVLPAADASSSLGMLMQQNSEAVQMQMTSGSMALEDMAKMGETSGVAMSMMINKQEQAPKSHAATFAETGLIPLYKKLYRLLQRIQHPLPEALGGYSMADFPKEIGLSFDVSSTVEKQQSAQNVINAITMIQQLYNGQLPKWVNSENVYSAYADYVAAGTGNDDVSAYLTDPKTIKPSELEIHMEALKIAAEESQLQAQELTPKTENEKLLSEIRKNNEQALYYAAQTQQIKEQDQQSADMHELNRLNMVMQNAKLAAETAQVVEETNEAPAKLALDAAQIESQITAEQANILDNNYAQGSNVNV